MAATIPFDISISGCVCDGKDYAQLVEPQQSQTPIYNAWQMQTDAHTWQLNKYVCGGLVLHVNAVVDAAAAVVAIYTHTRIYIDRQLHLNVMCISVLWHLLNLPAALGWQTCRSECVCLILHNLVCMPKSTLTVPHTYKQTSTHKRRHSSSICNCSMRCCWLWNCHAPSSVWKLNYE